MESTNIIGDVMERVIPTENIQIMLHYRNPFIVHHPNDTVIKQPKSILSGLTNTFADVSTSGETGVVFISFYPTGACHFFNFPLSEIENQSIDMSDVLGRDIKHLEEKLYFSQSVKQKISVIEEFLINQYSPIPSHDHLLINKGLKFIKNNKGQLHASSLSNHLSVTPKTLERKFSRYLGKTTKQMIKLIRFQEVLLDISNNKDLFFTERAYNNGYFDQSHFIHDFKTYSGYTPKEFALKYQDFNVNQDFC